MSNEAWVCNGVSFQSGDKVKIVRIEETGASGGMGKGIQWENDWSDYMSEMPTVYDMGYYMGHSYEINHIDETGAYFVDDEDHKNPFGYPLTALEKMETA